VNSGAPRPGQEGAISPACRPHDRAPVNGDPDRAAGNALLIRRSARRVLVVGALLLVLLNSTWFSATAVIPQVQGAWHLSPATSAWLTIAVQWGFAAGAVASAVFVISDIFQPPKLIFASSAGAALSNMALLFVHSALPGIAARLLTGFFIAGIYPPWMKLIATWYRRGRGMAMGVLVGALDIGEGLPYLVNALGGLNWRVVIITTSLATAGGGIITLWGVREGPYRSAQAKFGIRQAGSAVRNKPVRLAALGYIGHMWELYAAWTWFPVFALAAFSYHGIRDPAVPLLLTFGVFLSGAVATWTGGVLGDRTGREVTAIAMMTVSAACCLIIGPAFSAPVWLLVTVAIIWGYSVVGDSVQFSALVTENADAGYTGSALALQMASGFFLSGLTIWLIPGVRDLVGWQWAFAVLAPGPACGILAMRRSLRLRKTVPAQAEHTREHAA
jgi:MFS family permease